MSTITKLQGDELPPLPKRLERWDTSALRGHELEVWLANQDKPILGVYEGPAPFGARDFIRLRVQGKLWLVPVDQVARMEDNGERDEESRE